MDAQSFWNRLNEQIKKSNTTQRKLALECGFTERRIESLSTGNRLPDAFEITKIARALNTSVEFLTTGENTSHKVDVSKLKDLLMSALKETEKL